MRLILIPEGRARGSQLYCEFDGLALELRAQDLSLAGVFVITTTPPALDRELELLLRSPIGELALRGQVVQVISPERACAEGRQPGFGLLFVDLADDQRAFIGLSLDAAARAAAPSVRAKPRREPLTEQQVEQRQKLAARRKEVLDRLERELLMVQNKPPWAVLGLQPDAAPSAAHAAYLAVSKRCHPHVYAHLDSPEISRVATELFIAHKRAYTTLRSVQAPAPEPNTPQAPLEVTVPSTPRPPAASPRPSPAPLVDATVAARVGASLAPVTAPRSPSSLRPGRRTRDDAKPASARPGAARSARASASLPAGKRRTADAEIALAAGLKHLAASRFDEAAEEFERALALCSTLRDASVWLHVCRARKHKAAGRREQAAQEYRALLEMDPEHREALEHVGGGRASRRRSGLMGKLFGTENE